MPTKRVFYVQVTGRWHQSCNDVRSAVTSSASAAVIGASTCDVPGCSSSAAGGGGGGRSVGRWWWDAGVRRVWLCHLRALSAESARPLLARGLSEMFVLRLPSRRGRVDALHQGQPAALPTRLSPVTYIIRSCFIFLLEANK